MIFFLPYWISEIFAPRYPGKMSNFFIGDYYSINFNVCQLKSGNHSTSNFNEVEVEEKKSA
jgi:hypothetical protein